MLLADCLSHGILFHEHCFLEVQDRMKSENKNIVAQTLQRLFYT